MTSALIIFILTYLFIAVQKFPKVHLDLPSGALIGAVLMVVSGVLPLKEAYAAIDLDTILLLLGMMIVIAHLGIAGFFEWVAAKIIRWARTPFQLLALVVVISGLLSAFFVNDTVCLLLTPVLLLVLSQSRLNPIPYLIGLAAGSNVGGVMSVTGNPQNMLIGTRSGISYLSFLAHLAPVALIGLAVTIAVITWIHRETILSGETIHDGRPGDLPPANRPLLMKGLVITAGMAAAFSLGLSYPLVAISGAATVLLVGNHNPEIAFEKVDWTLLLFFGALFIVIGGVEKAGWIGWFYREVGGFEPSPGLVQIGQITVASVVLSNVVSNVPAVLALEPFLRNMASPHWAWLTAAMASTLAGNLTLFASVANLIVVQQARKQVTLTFWEILRVGVPVTLLTIGAGIGILWLEWRWFG